MTLRVTSPILIDKTLRNINNNLQQVQELQIQLASGRRVNRLSDDPVAVQQALRFKQDMLENQQYKENITFGANKLDAAINALDRISNLVLGLQDVALDMVTDPYSTSRAVFGNEINQLISEIALNANAKYLGKYLFGGHETLTPPYTINTDSNGNVTSVTRNPLGIDDPAYHTATDGLDVQVNISGSAPFMPNGEGNTGDIFTTLINIRDSILANDKGAVQIALDELDDEFQNIITQQAIAGQRIQQFDHTDKDNDLRSFQSEARFSAAIDLDFAKAITELNYQNFILQAALQVGSKIISPTLLDYI